MFRATLLCVSMFPAIALGQTMSGHHPGGSMAAQMGRPMAGMATQSGQAAFAAIQEIVEVLEADPATDWTKVNIEALRQHLIDMDNVTLHAEVTSEPVDGGMKFNVWGVGAIRDSVQRMVTGHAATMNGVDGWRYVATDTATGAELTVMAPPKDIVKLRALGFIGVLTIGMHHQMHHLTIARGDNPHH